ncbi:MAG TPA: glutaminyl-peptide cyclotransferase [Rhodopila sp.]|uniref:glutaminyl-peptide cyclotransferase n=1 Tax=Rhodopila sp. TaxID=2480087 RepID=UPI002B5352CD|nr:glutaminyl-peptide cyclotransferase [Rhodopila sp.]HVY14620.1 glutaminyl-peptide cyclotransferase [Rhodopila sp.]
MSLKASLLAAAWIVIPVCLRAAVPQYDVQVVAAYPHDPTAFTEGLFYRDGFLYEATGQVGQSSIRKVDLATGKVLQRRPLAPPYFGEGIVAWRNRLIELTWQNHVGFVYDLRTFKPLSHFPIKGEGWALTQDGARLIMSDGTTDLRILNPATLVEAGRIHVTCDGKPIRNINELEWVKDEVYANIWVTDEIVRIDPRTGDVVGAIDLEKLAAWNPAHPPDKVPNGIAYDAEHDRLFVTGKLWPKLYQVKLVPAAAPKPDICAAISGPG